MKGKTEKIRMVASVVFLVFLLACTRTQGATPPALPTLGATATPTPSALPTPELIEPTPTGQYPDSGSKIHADARNLYLEEWTKRLTRCSYTPQKGTTSQNMWAAKVIQGQQCHTYSFVEVLYLFPKVHNSQMFASDRAEGIEWRGWVDLDGSAYRTWSREGWSRWSDRMDTLGHNLRLSLRLYQDGTWEIAQDAYGQLPPWLVCLQPVDCAELPSE